MRTRLDQYAARWRAWFAPVSPAGEPESPEEVMGQSLWFRLQKWRAPLTAFLVGQPTVQLLNILTGFFLIRWMDVEQYAMLGIAFASQTMITQLVDVGFSGSIVALAGSRSREPEVLGGYIRAAKYWRTKTQIFILLLAIVAFPLMTRTQGWSTGTKVLLFITIALGVIFQGWIMYGAALLVHRDIAKYYRPQIVGSAARLVVSAALYWCGFLNAWMAALLGALAIAYNGLSFKKFARPYVREPDQSRPEFHLEMRKYVAPLIPAVIFVAFQGQILIAISAIFGATRNIAEVSALGRLSQIFSIFIAFNGVVLEPYISRISRGLLLRRYLQILASASVLTALMIVFAFHFPAPFLWLLGKNYANLHSEIAWTILSSCVTYLTTVMWTMHAARRWIFWWGTVSNIIILLMVQCICMVTMDLSKTLPVIYFGVITNVVVLLIQIATAVYGFRCGTDRQPPEEVASAS